MAYITTPGFGMQLADPATVQQFETSVVNANFLALEDGILVEQARVDTIVAGAARGTLTRYTVATLAALTAISNAAIGDEAHLSAAPSTGITPHAWECHAGSGATADWRPAEMIVAATKANLDTYIAAVIADADLTFEIGALVFVSGTQQFYRFTSTAGAYKPLAGLVPIVPTSVAGTGVTLGVNGKVSFTGSSAVNVNGCFTSEFENYLIIFNATHSVADYVAMRMRLAGVDASTASYLQQTLTANAAAVSAASTVSGTTGGIATQLANASDVMSKVTVLRPALAVPTTVFPETFQINNTSAAPYMEIRPFNHNVNAAYDGLSLLTAAGSMAGSLRIYGINNN